MRTLNGKGQVDPGAIREGANVLVARVEDKSCVPDLRPLPGLELALRSRREVVYGNAGGVTLRSLES